MCQGIAPVQGAGDIYQGGSSPTCRDMPAIQRSGLMTGQARTRMRARLEVLLVSENGKKTSVYVGDPIQRVKQRLRELNSPMTLSARLNQIAQRYQDLIVDGECADFSARDLEKVRHSLNGIDVTPGLLRGLDALIDDDNLARKVEKLSLIERVILIERLGI